MQNRRWGKDMDTALPCDKDSWKIDYVYSHKGYKVFDTKRNASEWIVYIFHSSLPME